MTNREKQSEAYANAVGNRATTNYGAILHGFIEKGIPADQILPRENVFTFWAWKELGRRVRKGEHGVKVLTWVPMQGKGKGEQQTENTEPAQDTTRAKKTALRPWTTTVFHISQTEPDPYASNSNTPAA